VLLGAITGRGQRESRANAASKATSVSAEAARLSLLEKQVSQLLVSWGSYGCGDFATLISTTTVIHY
jgi:hypothetical protein